MVRYTLRQCTYFRAVAEHGGIAQAARALNISQPSVAQALDKLEDVTGLVLFDRHHARGLTLTLQGRIFLQHVTSLEQQAQQVEREASALAAEAAGEIRLGVFWTLSPFYAAGLIRAFADEAPGVIVRQREMSLADLADSSGRARSIWRSLTIGAGSPMGWLSSNLPRSGRWSCSPPTIASLAAARSISRSWPMSPM